MAKWSVSAQACSARIAWYAIQQNAYLVPIPIANEQCWWLGQQVLTEKVALPAGV
jgi:hypothetical protein